MRIVGRLVMVPLGFIAGALTALFVLGTLGQERVVAALSTSATFQRRLLHWSYAMAPRLVPPCRWQRT